MARPTIAAGTRTAITSRFITLPAWARWVEAGSTAARAIATRAGAAVVASAGTVAVGATGALFPTKMGESDLTEEEREAAHRANAA